MMICPKCGHESNDGIKFCTKCGENLAVIETAARKKATISLILGIAGFLLGGTLSVIGLVFGIKSIKRKKNFVAIAGIILNILQLLFFAIVITVTISTIVVHMTRSNTRAQTLTDQISPYIGQTPILQWFTDIGQITTQTRDIPAHTVTIIMQLGYDMGDTATSSELFSRQHELRDFTRRYFGQRAAAELRPENEARLRREIMEILNTRYINSAGIRNIAFERLDVFELEQED